MVAGSVDVHHSPVAAASGEAAADKGEVYNRTCISFGVGWRVTTVEKNAALCMNNRLSSRNLYHWGWMASSTSATETASLTALPCWADETYLCDGVYS